MTNTRTADKGPSGKKRERHRTKRALSRRRARSAGARRRAMRRDAGHAGSRRCTAGGDLYEAGEVGIQQLRRAGARVVESAEQLREAGSSVLGAGEAGVELAREAASVAGDVAETATEHVSEAANAAGGRLGEAAVEAGRTAVEIGVQLMSLPEVVREAARRGIELVEEAGSRLAASVLHTGSRVLDAAADYVSELTPRRRVNRAALERLLQEQLGWARAGARAYDEAAADVDDDQTRVRLVRCKLQMIRQAETVTATLGRIGCTVPDEEQASEPHAVSFNGKAKAEDGQRRHRLAAALSIALASAEGWRALVEIAAAAASDAVADALTTAVEAVGREPQEQVEFLREALLHATVDDVLA